MAKIKKNNVILSGLSGTLGDLVFRQMPDGSTRMSVRPAGRGRRRTPGERENQKRFREASSYAKAASKDYPIYAELAKGTAKNAYNIALADYRKPPVIHCVERKDGAIRVQASDNVLVAEVRVKIVDAEGRRLEEGMAIRVDPEWWEYVSTTEGTVEVEARDLAWNEARKTM